MKKRVMSLLLVMLMVFALLPAAAMAADPVNPSQADSSDLHVTKKLEASGNGNYSITLESWATGNDFQVGGEAKPMDIVLVLDQSGSMNEDISIPSGSYRSTNYISYNNIVSGIGYIKVNGEYKLLYASKSGNNYSYWYGNSNINGEGAVVILRNKNGFTRLDYDDVTPHIDLYVANTTTSSRIDALKSAVNSFVDTLSSQKDGADNVIEHRVAVVGYANGNKSDQSGYNTNTRENDNTIYYNTEVFVGSNQYRYDKVTDGNLADALQYTSTAAGKRSLQNSVSALSTWTDTYSNYGLELAKNILDARSDADKETRGAAVILFTDGVPGGGAYNDDSVSVANKSIDFAHQMKSNGVTIFTIGVLQDDTDYLPGRNGYDTDYHIYQYMNYVSSNYPDAASLDNPGEEKSNTYYSNISGGTGSLTDLFGQISDKIDQSSTSVDLSADSALRDIINLSDFDAAGATVSAQVVKMAADTPDAEITLSYPATVPADGVINVTGFDYSQLFHTDAHPGYKLVVTITGLIPKHEGNLESNVNAGVFETADASEAVLAIGSPTLEIENKAVIIDYNYPVQLTTSLGNDNVSINGGAFTTAGKSGTYTKSGTSLTYQLSTSVLNPTEGKLSTSTELTDKYNVAIKAYAGADTAVFFETGKTWKAVTTVPANTVYYDDDILNTPVASGAIKGTGYNAGMTESEDDAFAGKMVYYTFKGTGIDVYSTTTDTSKLITAEIIDQDGNVVSSRSMRNFSKTERLNVPSVFFRDLPYGEYTLTLYASNNANYKIDGIRVYNPAGADETANGLYAEIKEQNATFNNLREMLLDNGADLINANGNRLNGAGFFLDNEKLEPNLANYTVNGPKNEIYLAQNTGVAFKIDNWQALQTTYGTNIKLMVGLSVPDANNTSSLVKLSDMYNGEATAKEQTVSSPVDMYYEVVPNAQGIVMIFNTGDKMVSLTNLKISGGTAPITASFAPTDASVLSVNEEAAEAVMNLVVDQDTLDYAANFASLRSTEEVAAEYEAQNFANMVRQLISDFITQLFNNIAKLFGK